MSIGWKICSFIICFDFVMVNWIIRSGIIAVADEKYLYHYFISPCFAQECPVLQWFPWNFAMFLILLQNYRLRQIRAELNKLLLHVSSKIGSKTEKVRGAAKKLNRVFSQPFKILSYHTNMYSHMLPYTFQHQGIQKQNKY